MGFRDPLRDLAPGHRHVTSHGQLHLQKPKVTLSLACQARRLVSRADSPQPYRYPIIANPERSVHVCGARSYID